jgi:hypothetical protein
MGYRILRLMEYTYPSVEEAEQDMRRWHLPACGVFEPRVGYTIHSTIIQHAIPDEEKEGHKHRASCHGAIGELLCGKEEGS